MLSTKFLCLTLIQNRNSKKTNNNQINTLYNSPTLNRWGFSFSQTPLQVKCVVYSIFRIETESRGEKDMGLTRTTGSGELSTDKIYLLFSKLYLIGKPDASILSSMGFTTDLKIAKEWANKLREIGSDTATEFGYESVFRFTPKLTPRPSFGTKC